MESVGTKREERSSFARPFGFAQGKASRGRLSHTSTSKLVAAGVVLRRDQNQARAAGFRLRIAAKRVQNADDGGVGSENAQANRCDDGYEEHDGHE